ncbi:hypothetical protein ABKN59_008556 [Abortiporus biennis]
MPSLHLSVRQLDGSLGATSNNSTSEESSSTLTLFTNLNNLPTSVKVTASVLIVFGTLVLVIITYFICKWCNIRLQKPAPREIHTPRERKVLNRKISLPFLQLSSLTMETELEYEARNTPMLPDSALAQTSPPTYSFLSLSETLGTLKSTSSNTAVVGFPSALRKFDSPTEAFHRSSIIRPIPSPASSVIHITGSQPLTFPAHGIVVPFDQPPARDSFLSLSPSTPSSERETNLPPPSYTVVPNRCSSLHYAKVHKYHSVPPPVALVPTATGSLNNSGSKKNSHRWTVTHTFEPSLPDELSICVQEILEVWEEYDDGWCSVKRVSGNQEEDGVVPRDCLEPILDAES